MTKYYLICSAPRSGTHFLANLLSNLGVGNPDENNLLRINAFKNRITHSYLSDVYYNKSLKNDIWGGVVHYRNFPRITDNLQRISGLYHLRDFELLKALLPNVKCILYHRINKVRQAVSHVKSFQDHAGTSNDPKKLDGNYVYKPDYISAEIRKCATEDSYWLEEFRNHNIQPHFFSYEELYRDKETAIRGILDFLEIPVSRSFCFKTFFEDNPSAFKKQSNEINEEWTKQFYDDNRDVTLNK